jgi:hypothetical protein
MWLWVGIATLVIGYVVKKALTIQSGTTYPAQTFVEKGKVIGKTFTQIER